MLSLTQHFSTGPQGTIGLKPGSNLSYKGTQSQIYNNTEIDRWFVGEFSSAKYTITAEFDSNQKEILEVLVVARPEHASYTILGRVSIEDFLIELDVSVNESWMSLVASPTSLAFNGVKVSFFATYAETMTALAVPTVVTSPSSPSGGATPGSTADHSFGTVYISGQDDVIATMASDGLNLIGGTGVTLVSDAETNSITFSSESNTYRNFAVIGQPTLTAPTSNSTLTFTAGSGISLISNSLSQAMTISLLPSISSLSVGSLISTGSTSLVTLTTSGNTGLGGTLEVTGATTVAGLTASSAVISGTLSAGAATVSSLIVNGNLTVNGTTTTVNSNTVSVADTNITVAKNATNGALADGGGITVAGANATLTWENSASAWSFNKTVVPGADTTYNLGSSSRQWNYLYGSNVVASALTGTLQTGAQANITSVGTLGSLTVSGTSTFAAVTASSLTLSGNLDLLTTKETVVDVTSNAITVYNYATASIFYHGTSPAADWTVNFTNLPTANGKSITISIIVPQPSTAYKITACQIDGATQTIKWAGSNVPAGNASKIDIWAFTFVRRASSWTVLASIAANFG
jgi:hypothetical protein